MSLLVRTGLRDTNIWRHNENQQIIISRASDHSSKRDVDTFLEAEI